VHIARSQEARAWQPAAGGQAIGPRQFTGTGNITIACIKFGTELSWCGLKNGPLP